ncbi:MAG: response regulator [Candidatus Omnitrophica bacterium]|nr:response regulator [Candidatus Omnitrophota bacterium]
MSRTAVRKKRIIVVDDEMNIADIISHYLGRQGYETYSVYTAGDALDLMEKKGMPDLIIMDEKMPGMSGTALIRLIRNRESRVPVILLTGSIGMLTASDEQKELFDCILIKPVRLRDLSGVIQKTLS